MHMRMDAPECYSVHLHDLPIYCLLIRPSILVCVCQSACLPVHLHLNVLPYLLASLPAGLPAYLTTYLRTQLPGCLFVCLSISRSCVPCSYLYFCLSVCLFARPFIGDAALCYSFCPTLYLYLRLSAYVSVVLSF